MTIEERADQIDRLYAMGFPDTAFYLEIYLCRDVSDYLNSAEVTKINRTGIHKGNL